MQFLHMRQFVKPLIYNEKSRNGVNHGVRGGVKKMATTSGRRKMPPPKQKSHREEDGSPFGIKENHREDCFHELRLARFSAYAQLFSLQCCHAASA
jgi:hypothetical protein